MELIDEEIKNWFRSHQADHSFLVNDKGERVEKLVWAKPVTSVYRVDYLAYGRNLIVMGDLGEAVYSWSQPVNLGWVSELNLDYFAGKCQASEKGRRYEAWDEETAIKNIRWHIKEYCLEDSKIDEFLLEEEIAEQVEKELKDKGIVEESEEFDKESSLLITERLKTRIKEEEDKLLNKEWEKFKDLGGNRAIYNQQEWSSWCQNNAYEFFGDQDWWEWAGSIGIVHDGRCRAHLIGLKMAMESLKEKVIV